MNNLKKVLSILVSILVLGLCLPSHKIVTASEDDYVKPVKIEAGWDHCMAIGDDGNLYTWGGNYYGQLGNGKSGENEYEAIPQKIELGNEVKPVKISAGFQYCMVIGSDGNLYTWGYNEYGQLGSGNNYDYNYPQKIGLGYGIKPKEISAGLDCCMAIGSDGNLYTWGNNEYGQLGSGNNYDYNYPQKIELGNGVKPVKISAGDAYCMAIGDDGNLYTWGSNECGQLGNGESGSYCCYNYPQKIELGYNVKAVEISSGCSHCMAIGSDGNLYTWGQNFGGSLGNGSTSMGLYSLEDTPQKIKLGNGVRPIKISAGEIYCMAIGDDGNLYTWGYNHYCQLGNGESAYSCTGNPQKIELSYGVKTIEIVSGSFHSMAIGDDDNLYTWGCNLNGVLGNGLIGNDTKYSMLPQRITLSANKSGNGKPQISYRTHVQKQGWQNYVYEGQMSGTSGKALRLEGINIKLSNSGYKGDILYKTHVQKIGWQDWVKNGAMSGTEGKALRLEAIQIKLTDELAENYDIYYRVHAQHFGWLGWAKNGAPAGTAGYAYRLEAIQIQLVPKGEKINGSTSNCFKQK